MFLEWNLLFFIFSVSIGFSNIWGSAKKGTRWTNIDDLFHQFFACLLEISAKIFNHEWWWMRKCDETAYQRDMDLSSKLSMFSWPTGILVYCWKLVLQRFIATGMKKHGALQKCTNSAIRNWLSDRNWRKEFNLAFEHLSFGIFIGSFHTFQSRFGQSGLCCKQTYWMNLSGKTPHV